MASRWRSGCSEPLSGSVTDAELFRAAVTASGLDATAFVTRVLGLSRQTALNWNRGTAIPAGRRAWLARWLALPARSRGAVVRALTG